jgi:hypothetical protein
MSAFGISLRRQSNITIASAQAINIADSIESMAKRNPHPV